MHNVRACKEAQSCSTSKISATCLVRCRKARTVRCGEVHREWKYVAHRYPRTGSADQPPKEKRPAARKKRRELGEEAFHGSASCLLNPTASGHRRSPARAFSRCSSMPSAWNSRSASSAADVPARTAIAAARSLRAPSLPKPPPPWARTGCRAFTELLGVKVAPLPRFIVLSGAGPPHATGDGQVERRGAMQAPARHI